MDKHIVNISELEFQGFPGGVPAPADQKYGATMAQIGMRFGSKKIGANITRVAPGKRAFPFHNHHANEELFYILEGSGEVRIGSETYPVKAGDFVFCPAGGPETAHQLANTGEIELAYLAISSKQTPEIAEYPDTGKFGVLGENFRYVGRPDQGVGYWEGE